MPTDTDDTKRLHRQKHKYFSFRLHGEFLPQSLFFPQGLRTIEQIKDKDGNVWIEITTEKDKRIGQIMDCIKKENITRKVQGLRPYILHDLDVTTECAIFTFGRGEREKHWFTKWIEKLRKEHQEECERRYWNYEYASVAEKAEADAVEKASRCLMPPTQEDQEKCVELKRKLEEATEAQKEQKELVSKRKREYREELCKYNAMTAACKSIEQNIKRIEAGRKKSKKDKTSTSAV